MVEDGLLDRAQRRAGLDAEVGGEEQTGASEGGERIRRSPGLVERPHQQPPGPLAVRVGLDEGFELADPERAEPTVEVGLGAVLGDRVAQSRRDAGPRPPAPRPRARRRRAGRGTWRRRGRATRRQCPDRRRGGPLAPASPGASRTWRPPRRPRDRVDSCRRARRSSANRALGGDARCGPAGTCGPRAALPAATARRRGRPPPPARPPAPRAPPAGSARREGPAPASCRRRARSGRGPAPRTRGDVSPGATTLRADQRRTPPSRHSASHANGRPVLDTLRDDRRRRRQTASGSWPASHRATASVGTPAAYGRCARAAGDRRRTL